MPASLENIIVIYRLIYSAFTIMLHHLTTTGHIVPLISMYWSTSDSCWTPMNWPNPLSPNSNSSTRIICINFFIWWCTCITWLTYHIVQSISGNSNTSDSWALIKRGLNLPESRNIDYWINDRILNISRAPDSWDPDEWGLICLNSDFGRSSLRPFLNLSRFPVKRGLIEMAPDWTTGRLAKLQNLKVQHRRVKKLIEAELLVLRHFYIFYRKLKFKCEFNLMPPWLIKEELK